MWDTDDYCRGCKSQAGTVIDHEARSISCSECGFVFESWSTEEGGKLAENDTLHSGFSIATTETKNGSFFLPSMIENPQNRGSDSLSIATTEPNNASSDGFLPSDHGNLQNSGSNCVSIADMSARLGLRARVKNQANEIFKEVEDQISGRNRNAVFGACIYIACRQTHMTCSLKQISSVTSEGKRNINKEIEFIAKRLGIDKNWLMQIKAADFIKRVCTRLGMDRETVKAAEEAAKSYTEIDTRSHVSVAAVVAYVIGRLNYEKKLLKGVIEATGVSENMIEETYMELHRHLSRIIPNGFANKKDLKKIGSP